MRLVMLMLECSWLSNQKYAAIVVSSRSGGDGAEIG